MPLEKDAIQVLDGGSEAIGKVYKTQDGILILTIRRIRKWPLVKYVTANHLTALRVIFAIVNVILFITGLFVGLAKFLPFMLSFTIIAYVSDYFDGPWARAEEADGDKDPDSDFGSWFDNTADKALCIPSMFFVMYLLGRYPAPLGVLAIDVSLGFFRTYIAKRYKLELRANFYGKLKTWLQGLGICFVLADYLIHGIGLVGYNILLFGSIPVGLLSLTKHIRNVYPQIQNIKGQQN